MHVTIFIWPLSGTQQTELRRNNTVSSQTILQKWDLASENKSVCQTSAHWFYLSESQTNYEKKTVWRADPVFWLACEIVL